jgi:hypothetical protein
MKDVIHQVLENSRCIDKVKKHNIIFKISIPCPERGLSFIASFNLNQIISSLKVNFYINLGLTKLIKKSRNKWQWIPIFYRNLIKATIVNIHPK